MDKILLALVGLPRSGKSTWVKEMEYRKEFYPVVSKDAIRLALHGRRYDQSQEGDVHRICNIMVQALFLSGHKIVCLDETNTTHIRRNTCLSREWKVRFKVFNTSEEECIRRANAIGDIDIIPIIEKMAAQWEPLTDEEQTRIWKGKYSL